MKRDLLLNVHLKKSTLLKSLPVGSSLCATKTIKSLLAGCLSLGLSPNCSLN